MSSISSVATGAGTAILANSSVAAAIGKPGQSVEPSDSASATVSLPYYTSPRIYVDPQYGEVVYEYRDPETGSSTSQIPSKQQLSAYQALQTIAVTSPAVSSSVSAPVATGVGQSSGTVVGAATAVSTPSAASPAPAPVTSGPASSPAPAASPASSTLV
jgi:hypothetical protein